MKKKKKEEWVDDGRRIANMNVEGMRDYCPMPENSDGDRAARGEAPQKITLEKGERRALYFGIFKAMLLVTAVFVAAYTLFMLFVYYIWL